MCMCGRFTQHFSRREHGLLDRRSGEPSAALQCSAGKAGRDRVRRIGRMALRHDALGPDPLVDEGIPNRSPVDQRLLGDDVDEVVIPLGLAVMPLPPRRKDSTSGWGSAVRDSPG